MMQGAMMCILATLCAAVLPVLSYIFVSLMQLCILLIGDG